MPLTAKAFGKYADRVDEIDDTRHAPEPNGIWVYLKPGWQNALDPGCHQIHEDTVTACKDRVQWAIPCECADCKKC